MIDYLGSFLPIIIYILLIVLLVLLINICLKAVNTIQKFDKLVENVDGKIDSLSGFFGIIDVATDRLSLFSDKAIELVAGIISKIFKKKKNSNIEEESEDE